MNPIPDHLSLWELAHRWHDAVPSAVDDSSVTRAIRDTLLALIQEVLRERLPVYRLDIDWMVEGEKKHSPSFGRFDPPREMVMEDFEEMFRSGTLDRSILQAYSANLDDVFQWCDHEEYDPPDLGNPAPVTTELKREAVSGKGSPRSGGQGEMPRDRR